MALLILMPDRDSNDLAKALKKTSPGLDIRIWPEVGDEKDIKYAIVWNHPAGALRQYPNLKVIASYGAGVDHIFKDPDLPGNIIITRLVDDSLSRQMSEYIAGVVLNHRLRLTEYREYQAAGVWSPKAARPGNIVCLLGLGNIGREVAGYLSGLNFTIHGWSQSHKDIENIATFHGDAGLCEALGDADYIVCLLPLTPKTADILNKSLFSKIKKGAYLINAGRGGHLNEDDLLDALYQGRLGGACLDVFRTEPLPDDHPFWRHPKISITPHTASLTNIDQAASQFHENYLNMVNNRPLFNRIDSAKGY
ncbi:MAG: glyoxylate/hydroxypyruvate reductase A [Alphaproteobacteria bacterium]|nr:MAG: glyoxylate/hydroxypyruvate reductase A [Alphaproteobacteria bacterium]